MEQNYFRRCSSCKKEIGFGKIYQVCEITSCKKHGFCSVNCWNLHNEIMNHKNAGAIESIAPFSPMSSDESAPPRRIIINKTQNSENIANQDSSSANSKISPMESEILIVASKLKQYIKDKYDLNTSQNVFDILSNIVRQKADEAAKNAIQSQRKTVMDRDFH